MVYFVIGLRLLGGLNEDDVAIAVRRNDRIGVPVVKLVSGYFNR